jgi:hypothetical protein
MVDHPLTDRRVRRAEVRTCVRSLERRISGRAFNVVSMSLIVATFALYKWAGVSVVPLVIAGVGRLVLAVWLWAGRGGG